MAKPNKDMPYPPGDCEDRFWSKVQVGEPDECWEWVGAYSTDSVYRGDSYRRPNFPYSITHEGKRRRIYALGHRVAFYFKYHRWPDEEIHHLCENTRCVNTNHLIEVTHPENMAHKRGMTYKKHKERKPEKMNSHIPPIPSHLKSITKEDPDV